MAKVQHKIYRPLNSNAILQHIFESLPIIVCHAKEKHYICIDAVRLERKKTACFVEGVIEIVFQRQISQICME